MSHQEPIYYMTVRLLLALTSKEWTETGNLNQTVVCFSECFFLFILFPEDLNSRILV